MTTFEKLSNLPKILDLTTFEKLSNLPKILDLTTFAKLSNLLKILDLTTFAKLSNLLKILDLTTFEKLSNLLKILDLTTFEKLSNQSCQILALMETIMQYPIAQALRKIIDSHNFNNNDGCSCLISDKEPYPSNEGLLLWFSSKTRIETKIQLFQSPPRIRRMEEMLNLPEKKYVNLFFGYLEEFLNTLREIGFENIGKGVNLFGKGKLFNVKIDFELFEHNPEALKEFELITLNNPIVKFVETQGYFTCTNRELMVWEEFASGVDFSVIASETMSLKPANETKETGKPRRGTKTTAKESTSETVAENKTKVIINMETNSLANKVVLITGSSRRIGAAIAHKLHAAGMKLAIHYHHSEIAAHALQAELNNQRTGSVLLLQADLLQVSKLIRMIQQIIEYYGRLDVLVNNASIFYSTPISKVEESEWEELLGTNLKAPFFLSQAAAPHLNATQGCIINLADIHAERPLKSYSVYSIAKAGVVMLTKTLARELGPSVRVNAISPGAILWPENDMDEVTKQRIISNTVLKRAGTAEDIARTVLFLICDADYMTGQVITIDGGRTLSQ